MTRRPAYSTAVPIEYRISLRYALTAATAAGIRHVTGSDIARCRRAPVACIMGPGLTSILIYRYTDKLTACHCKLSINPPTLTETCSSRL